MSGTAGGDGDVVVLTLGAPEAPVCALSGTGADRSLATGALCGAFVVVVLCTEVSDPATDWVFTVVLPEVSMFGPEDGRLGGEEEGWVGAEVAAVVEGTVARFVFAVWAASSVAGRAPAPEVPGAWPSALAGAAPCPLAKVWVAVGACAPVEVVRGVDV